MMIPAWLARALARLEHRDVRRRIVSWPLRYLFANLEHRLVGPGRLAGAEVHRILVIRPNHRLGNILMLTPLIDELERVFPGAEIDVIAAGTAAAEVLAGWFSVCHVHALPRRIARHPLRTLRLVLKLRRTRYDLGIDASANSLSARLLLASAAPRFLLGAPAPDNAVWARVMFSAPRHLAKLPVFLLRRALACEPLRDEPACPRLHVRLSLAERAMGRRTVASLTELHASALSPSIIGVFANATGKKCLDPAWWIAFLAALRAQRPHLSIVELIAADGRSRLGDRFPSYYSNAPRKLGAVMANLRCVVSGDCGVMHLATAVRTPTIGLFTASDATMYEPYGCFDAVIQTSGAQADDAAAAAARLIDATPAPAIACASAGSAPAVVKPRVAIAGTGR